MTPVNGSFDQMLRSALHTEVDSIEPADGGLDRIRRRTHAPWLVRQASLMLTECTDLVRLIGIRVEPGFTGTRATVAARGGLWAAFAGVLSSIVALFMPSRRRPAMHRSGPGGRTGSSGPPPERRNLAWLRPVLAVMAAVVIVVAGVFGLTQMRDKLVLELFPGNAPASNSVGTSSTSNQVPTLQGRQSTPGVVVPASTQPGSPKPSPKATCKSAPHQQVTSTPTSAGTTTPSATPSDTSTPTPTDTTSPSPTATVATSAPAAGGGTGSPTAVNAVPAATCANPASS